MVRSRALRASVFFLALAGCGGGTAAVHEGAAAAGAEPTEAGKKQLQTLHAMESAFNTGDAKAFAALFADDVVINVGGRPDARGRAAAEAGFERLRTSLGKPRYRLRRVLLAGDTAVVEFALSGTNESTAKGAVATHKPIGWVGGEVDRFAADGRIVERRVYVDGTASAAQIAGAADARPLPADVPLVVATGRGAADPGVLDRVLKAVERRDTPALKTVLAAEAEWDDLSRAKPVRGPDELGKAWSARARDDASSGTINAWSAGAFAAAETTFSTLERGELVATYELHVAEVKDGKVVRGWTFRGAADRR